MQLLTLSASLLALAVWSLSAVSAHSLPTMNAARSTNDRHASYGQVMSSLTILNDQPTNHLSITNFKSDAPIVHSQSTVPARPASAPRQRPQPIVQQYSLVRSQQADQADLPAPPIHAGTSRYVVAFGVPCESEAVTDALVKVSRLHGTLIGYAQQNRTVVLDLPPTALADVLSQRAVQSIRKL